MGGLDVEENTFVGTYLREKNMNLGFIRHAGARRVTFDRAEVDVAYAEAGALTCPYFGAGLGFRIHDITIPSRKVRTSAFFWQFSDPNRGEMTGFWV